MATFANLGLAEPSTITARVGTISIDRGSTSEHQEITCIGDPETSNAITRVVNTTPASTDWGIVTRPVGQSTTVQVSSLGGVVAVAQNSTTWQVQVEGYVAPSTTVTVSGYVAPSTTVTVSGYVAPSTTVQVSSVAGQVTVRPSDTSWASSAGFHFDSSGALQIAGATNSTTVNVSSLAGNVTVAPTDTNWASSAGFHFDSSGALQITGASASTVVSISSVSGTVTVDGNQSSNSSVYLPVRLTNGTAFLTPAQDYTHGSTLTASSITGPTVMLRASSTTPGPVSTSDMFVLPWGSLNGAQYTVMATDSGASVMDSTNRAMNVNVVAGSAASTTVNVSSLAGNVTVAPSDTSWASSAGFHFDSSGALQITGASASTQVAVSSLAGRVTVAPSDTSWASSAGFHFDSSGALQITGASASTQVAVSSLAGRVTVAPSDTAWASSAGFHFDSSGALQITGGTSSTVVTVNGNASSNSSLYLPVRFTNGTAFITPAVDYTHGSTLTASSITGPAILLRASSTTPGPVSTSDMFVMPWGSLNGAQYTVMATDSGVSVMDSTNRAMNVNVVAGSAASTTVNVSSLAGRVTVAPSDTSWASSAGFHFTSSGELQISGTFSASTTVNISSVSGLVTVTPSSTDWASSAGFAFATANPSTAGKGVLVRPVLGGLASYASSTQGASTAETIVSSAATARAYVFAYSVTSTVAGPQTVKFVSSNANTLWSVRLAAVSSAISGANLAVSPPGYLFRTNVGEGLTVRLAGSSHAGNDLSIGYWVST